MYRTLTAAGLTALAALFAPAGAARAADDDVIRLELPGTKPAAPARTLAAEDEDLDGDFQLAGYRGFRGGAVGWRGGAVGWRGGAVGWGGGWRGGAVGWRGGAVGWGGGWRGGVAWRGGWRGWSGGWYGRHWGPRVAYWPRYYGGFGVGVGVGYPVYSFPVYSYSYPVESYYVDPCAATVVAPPVTTTVIRTVPSASSYAPAPRTDVLPRPGITAPPPMPRADGGPDGTFDYNGGPTAPVPMPRIEEEARELPRVPTPMPATERLVSLPSEPKTGKWVYPAYGEAPRRTGR